jgi:hypothetical protein
MPESPTKLEANVILRVLKRPVKRPQFYEMRSTILRIGKPLKLEEREVDAQLSCAHFTHFSLNLVVVYSGKSPPSEP